jgi:hypothetical protein
MPYGARPAFGLAAACGLPSNLEVKRTSENAPKDGMNDPSRYFTIVNCCIAKGLFDHLWAGESPSLNGSLAGPARRAASKVDKERRFNETPRARATEWPTLYCTSCPHSQVTRMSAKSVSEAAEKGDADT